MAEPQRGPAFHFHPNCMLSSHINSKITSQVCVGILTFKVAVSGVHMAFISFFVTFNVTFDSIFSHFVTFSGLDLALPGI